MPGRFFSFLVILICVACVDRINIDVGITTYPVVIDGNISDRPGPYRIDISRAFDIESKITTKTPIAAKKVTIFDNAGFSEILTAIEVGRYETSSSGIRGKIGGVYKIQVEMLDGKIYESIPDTILSPGSIDSVYFKFMSQKDANDVSFYGFDVFFNSGAAKESTNQFLWKFVGTYKTVANPELYTVACGESRCPRPLPCSAYDLGSEGLVEVRPCVCCECWVNYFNDTPLVSNNQFVEGGRFNRIKIGYVPVNQWAFIDKVHAEAQQQSLTKRAFDFWRSVESQKGATESLFQPISGKIPRNFTQLAGAEAPVEGIFYATGITSKAVFITRNDVPDQRVIPERDFPFPDTCTKLFPFSSTKKPSYWK